MRGNSSAACNPDRLPSIPIQSRAHEGVVRFDSMCLKPGDPAIIVRRAKAALATAADVDAAAE